MSISDSAPGSPQTVPLSGASLSVVLSFNPAMVEFPVVTVGAASSRASVTATNIGIASTSITSVALGGANPGDFSIASSTCGGVLTAGASCTVNVVFVPTANGIRTANLLFSDTTAGLPQAFQLIGTAEGAVQSLVISPSTLVFSPVTIGNFTTGTVFAANYTSSSVNFLKSTITGIDAGDFSVFATACSPLPVNYSCAIYVSFTPSAPGVRTATLVVQDTAPGSPQSLPLVGTGITATQTLWISPETLVFAPANLGVSTSQQLTLTNCGTTGVSFSKLVITGTNTADFQLTSTTCGTGPAVLAPQTGCMVGVTFTPSAAGPSIASLVLADSAPGSPQPIPLTGTGTTPSKQLTFSTGTVEFGPQAVSYPSDTNSVTLTNVGLNAVTFSNIAIAGASASNFTIHDATCVAGLQLAPTANCIVDLVFTPSAANLSVASLNFTDDAGGSPQSVNLDGVGSADTQNLVFSNYNLDFGLINLGSPSANLTFYVSNNGDTPIVIRKMEITGANATDFLLNNNSCVSPGGIGSCQVYVSFTPSAAGVRTAQIEFIDSAPGSPQSVGLSGVGQALDQTAAVEFPSLVFPAQAVGSTGLLYNYFENFGDAPVVISSISITGSDASAFALSSNQCTVGSPGVPANSSCAFYVSFTPSTVGLLGGSLEIVDTATGSPQSIPLVGVGSPPAPPLTLSPTDANFSYQSAGSTSAPLDLTVSNTSASSVLLSIVLTGPNSADFNIASNSCGSSVAPGAKCSVSTTFTPLALGPRSAALQFTASGTVFYAGLSGVGTSGAITLTPYPLRVDFGVVDIAATSNPQAVNIANTGTEPAIFSNFTIAGQDPADFVIVSNACAPSLAPGAFCYLYLAFTPTASGVRTASLQFVDNATGSPQSVALNGMGQAVTKVLEYPMAIVFAPAALGGYSLFYPDFISIGTGPIDITGMTITGVNAADFALTIDTCNGSYPEGVDCFAFMQFTPSALGVRTAFLQISDDGLGNPQMIPLTGIGVPALDLLVAPEAATAPLTPIGMTNKSMNVTLNNVGNTFVYFTSFSITGTNSSDFAINSNGCPAQAMIGPCTINIAFTPAGVGPRIAALQITDSAAGSPQTVILTGAGEAPTRVLAIPEAQSFPVTTVATTYSSGNLSLDNIGTLPVTLGNIAITGPNATDFSIATNTCTSGAMVAPGASCAFNINFTPSGLGTRTATLQFTDNATGSPQSIALAGVGRGVTNTAAVSPETITFPSGGLLPTNLTNTGTSVVTLNSYTFTGPDAGDFSIDTGRSCAVGIQIAPGAGCGIWVNFTPLGTGTRTATLNVNDTALGSPQTVAITGPGQ